MTSHGKSVTAARFRPDTRVIAAVNLRLTSPSTPSCEFCPRRRSVQSWHSYATTPFDFFSAMYFLIARRLLFLLRFRQFFRASCFMPILLVRRNKPAGCLRMGVLTSATKFTPPFSCREGGYCRRPLRIIISIKAWSVYCVTRQLEDAITAL